MQPMRKILSVALALAGFTAACYFAGRPEQSDATVRTIPLDVKNVAPDFTLEEVGAGRSVHLRDEVKKHPVVITFWATWCMPCRAELPQLDRIAHKYAGRVAVYGINGADKAADIATFAHQSRLTIPMLHDFDQKVSLRYDTQKLPDLYVVDTKGIIRGISNEAGPNLEAELSPLLDRLLAESKNGAAS
jgi:thiol-disulfide isomerase/thioredoxin